jgi:hypothetical protein
MTAEAGIVVSDLHIASTAGLCPPWGIRVDGGGTYMPNKYQGATWVCWKNFWEKHVPRACEGLRPKFVVLNGDIFEGLHHNQTGVVTTTWEEMKRAALTILGPIREICDRLYIVRGTEAHAGRMGEAEEGLGVLLGAEENDIGERSSWQLWGKLDNVLCHFAHHISTTSSAAYETSAPMRELTAALVEAAQWDQPMPHLFVRSHRHRFGLVPIPSATGDRIQIVVTPGWQLKTPHVERIDRMRLPHIGGVVLLAEAGSCQVRERLYPPKMAPIKQL